MSSVKLKMAYTTISKMESELAALREELANAKARSDQEIDSADEETSALREIIRDLKDWRECSQSLAAFASILERAESVTPAPGPLRKALTAAEQRNAAITELLRQAATYGGLTLLWHDKVQRFIKPTESGASE